MPDRSEQTPVVGVTIDLNLHDQIGNQIEAAGDHFIAGRHTTAARLLREAADRIDPDGREAAIQAVREERDRQYDENVSLIARLTASHNDPNWIEWRIAIPGPGRKFIVAHDDGCSSAIYVMLDDGPHDAEDGENYGMDDGVLWMLLPDNYPIRFMEVTEEDSL